MKKTLLLSVVLFVSLTVNADIITWNTYELLTSKDAVPYADLSYEYLSFADLWYADLSYADLTGSDLSFAALYDADLIGAKASYADLSYTTLTYANLSGANLFGVDLTAAGLMGSDFTDATLSGAVLTSANNWQTATYTNALYTTETIFPDGFDPVAEGMILVPEPMTLSLLALGGLLIGPRVRARKCRISVRYTRLGKIR